MTTTDLGVVLPASYLSDGIKGRDGAPCGRPVQRDFYGDGQSLYWERCGESIHWSHFEGQTVWCTAGHEVVLA